MTCGDAPLSPRPVVHDARSLAKSHDADRAAIGLLTHAFGGMWATRRNGSSG